MTAGTWTRPLWKGKTSTQTTNCSGIIKLLIRGEWTPLQMYGKFEGFPLKFVKLVWVEEFIMTHDPLLLGSMVSFRRVFPVSVKTPILQWGPRDPSVFHGTVVVPCRLGGFAVGGNPEKKRDSVSYRLYMYIYIYRIYLYTYKNVIWSDLWNSLRKKVVEEYHSNFNEDLKTWSNTYVLIMPHEMFENRISTRTDAENWKPMVHLSSIQNLWLFAVFLGDYTTQLYRDYYKPW